MDVWQGPSNESAECTSSMIVHMTRSFSFSYVKPKQKGQIKLQDNRCASFLINHGNDSCLQDFLSL